MVLMKLDCQRAIIITAEGLCIVDMLPTDPVDTGPDESIDEILAPVTGPF